MPVTDNTTTASADQFTIDASSSDDKSTEQLLSALADGQCSDFELRRLLRDMDTSPDQYRLLLARWNETQVLSDLLARPGQAGSGGPFASSGFAAAVSAAIEQEPAHRAGPQFWKPLSQALVAASVAAVALVGIQQINTSAVSPESLQQPAAVTQSFNEFPSVVIPEGFELPNLQTQNVSATQTVRLLPLPTAGEPQMELDAVQLNQYLQEVLDSHYNSAVQASGTVFPYLRSTDAKSP